jgi:hypothetical protein
VSKFTRKKTNGGVEGLVKRVKTPGTVDVGIIDAGTHVDGDLTVASIGFIHEFGTEDIPERSFMRSTLREKKKEIITLQKQLLRKIVNGSSNTVKALGLLGEVMADFISQKITTLKTPPNAPGTIIAKGSSNPLVDTGQLRNSITYEVNR